MKKWFIPRFGIFATIFLILLVFNVFAFTDSSANYDLKGDINSGSYTNSSDNYTIKFSLTDNPEGNEASENYYMTLGYFPLSVSYFVTPICGNDIIQSGEFCDGDDLGGYNCASFGELGDLKCESDCSAFDFSDCYIPFQASSGGVYELVSETGIGVGSFIKFTTKGISPLLMILAMIGIVTAVIGGILLIFTIFIRKQE